jgi:hypothetical protein
MLQSSFRKRITYSSAILCITACVADLVLIYIFGKQIPCFNQLKSTLSSLGVSTSPVAGAVTVWSVSLGIILVFFAFGFRLTFHTYGKQINKASWLIVLYGLGECVASGIFRADRINGELTNIAYLHDFLGGIGVVALLLLPFIMRKIFSAFSFPIFFRYSGIISVVGILSTLLFSFRLEYFAGSFLYNYSGLWQRIFLINYYAYFIVIAIMMIQNISSLRHIKNNII